MQLDVNYLTQLLSSNDENSQQSQTNNSSNSERTFAEILQQNLSETADNTQVSAALDSVSESIENLGGLDKLVTLGALFNSAEQSLSQIQTSLLQTLQNQVLNKKSNSSFLETQSLETNSSESTSSSTETTESTSQLKDDYGSTQSISQKARDILNAPYSVHLPIEQQKAERLQRVADLNKAQTAESQSIESHNDLSEFFTSEHVDAISQFTLGEDGASVMDAADALNPLNHVPFVNDWLADETDHQVSGLSNILGSYLYAGPVGLGYSLLNGASQIVSEKSISQNLIDFAQNSFFSGVNEQ